MTIKCRDEIKDLLPYMPGKPIEDVKAEYNISEVTKLASNENPLGCSPDALDTIRNTTSLELYPDGNCTALKKELSKRLDLSCEEIILSNGSDEMIDMLAKTFLNNDDEVIMSSVTFPRYFSVTQMMGAKSIIVPLKEWTFDLDGMFNALTDKTKLIWLCNPNNPTGTMFTEDELLKFLNSVPKNVIVVYDEAYNEYVTRDDYPRNTERLLKDYPNLIIMRTFSKIYGLAALRVGYTLANKNIVKSIEKIRCAFNVNSIAQNAALAALNDDDFVKKSYEMNIEGKKYLYKEFDQLGFEYAKTETNHIFVDVKEDAQFIFDELQKRGMIIRPFMDSYIRVTIGTPKQNEMFIKKLKEVLNK